jgi:phosphoribosylformylglycinamidine synthase subunit PurQ / glutaminase
MVNVLILRAPGTNCDLETVHAFEQAGAAAERVHINRLLDDARTESGRTRLAGNFQILCIPGGFSYGDDIAAGRILASQLRHHLGDALGEFRERGGLILGICNGFQVLIRTGLLLADDGELGPPATLAWNASGRFEDRWVRLAVRGERSVFLAGIESMYLPVAHAEGKFVVRDEQVLTELERGGQLVLKYQGQPAASGESAAAEPARVAYPDNPNGSQADVAGVCDLTGRVLGLMPHPERYIDRTQHPRWTRGEGSQPGDGLRVFQNAVRYFKD